MSGEISIQERLYPEATCFGCGQRNPDGLRLRSYPTADGAVATFRPWPQHDNGLGFLNGCEHGGIILGPAGLVCPAATARNRGRAPERAIHERRRIDDRHNRPGGR